MKTCQKMRARLVVLFFGIFSLGASAGTCGGDGPQPFINISPSFNPPVSSIGSLGAVQEYVFWEKQNALIYRNNYDQLRGAYFDEGYDKVLTNVGIPISRIIDDDERYLITAKESYFFDSWGTSKGWIQFWKENTIPTHLFWYKGLLFSMDQVRGFPAGQVIRTHTYPAGTQSAFKLCSYAAPLKSDVFIADGHQFPNVFLYRKHAMYGGQALTFYKMNVNTCAVDMIGSMTEVIEGKIERVTRFDELDAFAVKIKHPTKNYRWEQEGRCKYYHIDSGTPLIPSLNHPTIVTWNRDEGTTLYNLAEAKKANVMGTLKLDDIQEKDLWITSKNELLISPKWKHSGYRTLIRLTLDGFQKK